MLLNLKKYSLIATSIQDLKNQLEIMNKQNKDLLKQLKQSQQQNKVQQMKMYVIWYKV
jgi:hypothetical protein